MLPQILKHYVNVTFTDCLENHRESNTRNMNYLMENSILCIYHSILCKNHSADTSPFYLTGKILTVFDSGIFVGTVFINLQNIFDTLNHKIQNFRVIIQNKYSTAAETDWGGPQKSFLGTYIIFTICCRSKTSCRLWFMSVCRWFLFNLSVQRH